MAILLENSPLVVPALKVHGLGTLVMLWTQRNHNLGLVGENDVEALFINSHFSYKPTNQAERQIRKIFLAKLRRPSCNGGLNCSCR